MRPRARRISLVAAALGMGLTAVLVLANWTTVRDHVETWWLEACRLKPSDVQEVVVTKVCGYYGQSISNQDDIARIFAWLHALNLHDRYEDFGGYIKGKLIATYGKLEFVLTNGDKQVLTLWPRHVTWQGHTYENPREYIKELKAILISILGQP